MDRLSIESTQNAVWFGTASEFDQPENESGLFASPRNFAYGAYQSAGERKNITDSNTYHSVASILQLVCHGKSKPAHRSDDPFKAIFGLVDKQMKKINRQVENEVKKAKEAARGGDMYHREMRVDGKRFRKHHIHAYGDGNWVVKGETNGHVSFY